MQKEYKEMAKQLSTMDSLAFEQEFEASLMRFMGHYSRRLDRKLGRMESSIRRSLNYRGTVLDTREFFIREKNIRDANAALDALALPPGWFEQLRGAARNGRAGEILKLIRERVRGTS